MISERWLRRVERARGLLEKREYAVLLNELSDRVIPAGNPVLWWDRLVIVELAEPRTIRRRTGVEPVLATPADIDALCAAVPGRAALFRRRVAGGQRCYVVKHGDRIVARQWLVPDRPGYDTNSGLRFEPPHRPALWCHDIFVEPEYRMRGHFVALMENARRVGTVDGRPPRLYGEIHFLNHGSIRAHESFGYRIIRRVTALSCLALKVYVIDDEEGRRRIERRTLWRVEHI